MDLRPERPGRVEDAPMEPEGPTLPSRVERIVELLMRVIDWRAARKDAKRQKRRQGWGK